MYCFLIDGEDGKQRELLEVGEGEKERSVRGVESDTQRKTEVTDRERFLLASQFLVPAICKSVVLFFLIFKKFLSLPLESKRYSYIIIVMPPFFVSASASRLKLFTVQGS